jgi:hypothetical protein
MSAQLPKDWKIYGVRVTLKNFKNQWVGARRYIGKRHDMVIAAPNEVEARNIARRRCFQTETYAGLFIDNIEVWEMELPRGLAG